jgi:transcriptional regulator GlxA family with amidase domain
MRSEGVRQRTPSLMSDETTDALPILVKQAIELFAQNVEFPLSTQEVAKALNVSPRQLERNFRDALDESPARYYRIIRLRAARQLVRFTNQPISEIAESVGYGTTTRFSHLYKDMFGLRPTEDRSRANSFRVEENLPLPSTTPSLDGV